MRADSVRFRCRERDVVVRRADETSFELSTNWRGSLCDLPAALRAALAVPDPVPLDMREIEVVGWGWIRSHTWPTTSWTHDLAGSSGINDSLEAALMSALVEIDLMPLSRVLVAVPLLDTTTFHRTALLATAEPTAWAHALAELLQLRLQAAADPRAEVQPIIDDLRQLDHNLYGFDESDDWQIWCADWTQPHQPRALVIRFTYTPYERPGVTVDVSD